MKRMQFACLAAALALLFGTTGFAAPGALREIIVFGHSHADNGNDHILSGGVVVPPPYFGGRFSNGPLWVERLAERLGIGHSTEGEPVPAPSEAGGSNYAYGGAETGSGFSDACLGVGPTKVCAPNVGLQIEMFFADGGTLEGDELVVVHAGENDNSAEIAARNMGEHIAALAAAGGKSFLVPNMARLSQSPGEIRADPAPDNFVARFNAYLAEELDALEARFDIVIYRFDLLGLQDAMIRNPTAFGLANVTDPACPGCGFGIPESGAEQTIAPNPDDYMYWDTGHFTRVVHETVGDAAADLVLSRLP